MIEQAAQALVTVSRRMLDMLGRRLQADPSEANVKTILQSFTKPWGEVFAYTRLASMAEGMIDAANGLPWDYTPEEQQDLLTQAELLSQQITDPDALLAYFEPQELVLVRPWFGMPPEAPQELELDLDFPFNVKLPSYEWALQDLANRRLVTRDEWDQLEQEELEECFTVAGLQTDAALARVLDSLQNTLDQSWTLEEFKDAAGGGRNFLNEWHAENVMRTNLHQVLSDGKMAVLDQPLVSDAFPYATIDPIGDDRVRPSHLVLATAGLNGTNVYRIDDPVFITFRPPWDFACRCGWGALTVRQAAAKGVLEARYWLNTGKPPERPEYVKWPTYRGAPLQPSPTYRRAA